MWLPCYLGVLTAVRADCRLHPPSNLKQRPVLGGNPFHQMIRVPADRLGCTSEYIQGFSCAKLARYLIASHLFRFTLGASPPILWSDATAHVVGLPLAVGGLCFAPNNFATRWRETDVFCSSPYTVRQRVKHGRPYSCLEILLS